ncbi:MAG: hypothetical protein IKE42_15345 [Aquamicrobium sp.]|nr:hypothetical protein [Aquamicrobium sp.]
MTLIRYIEKKFRSSSLQTIEQANSILEEYAGDGYTLTLRQLYYQFVARGLIENSDKSYDNLGGLISDARLAGLVSWTAIEDRGRTCRRPYVQESIAGALAEIQEAYSPDLWSDQENYIEIWVEKDALINVIERPADRWQIAYLACKGYLSSSEAWRAGQRFIEAGDAGKKLHLIHLGDHDPSGIDMTRDNGSRLDLFGAQVEVHRIALNMDQVQAYTPPPNPAKVTDSRAKEYIQRFGKTSWELDALEPAVLARLIDDKVRELLDVGSFNAALARREEERSALEYISDHADDALDWARQQLEEGY